MSDIARRDDVTSQPPPPLSAEAVVSVAQAPSLARPPLRLWPGVVIVALLWAALKVPGWVVPGSLTAAMLTFWSPMVAAVLFLLWWGGPPFNPSWLPRIVRDSFLLRWLLFGPFLLWWLFFSRARWADRLLLPLACAAVGFAAILCCEPNPMVRMYAAILYGIPGATTAWVGWLLITPFLGWPARRVGLLALFVATWGWLPLVRVEGVDGALNATLAWRWSPTAEDLARAERAARLKNAAAPLPEAPALRPGDWPGFRGSGRDSRLTGVRIATDWQQRRPRELWRHRVGPGWSSFAVIGERLYTQEQWDQDEAVVCYNAANGEELWTHKDKARFAEVAAGPGPRATPTFHDGKLYTLGAAGKLNCLDAATGQVIWSRDIAADSGAAVPTWGFASSPLVAQGIVSVFAGGPAGKSVMAYRAATGEPAWSGGEGQLSYCSPQLSRLGGVEQVLIATDAGLTAFHPTKGDVLWKHDWKLAGGARVCQPAVLSDTDVLLGTPMSLGARRMRVGPQADGSWAAQEVWTSLAIKPYFNDLVIHDGHLYGFDGVFFTCVSLQDGASKWRQRGYGSGQVLLVADQGLLLVLSEKGEVALVKASPEGHQQLGKFSALKGKTWNHPVVAHGKLFVRNGEEMACYELAEE